jgi:hypothetical protein
MYRPIGTDSRTAPPTMRMMRRIASNIGTAPSNQARATSTVSPARRRKVTRPRSR